MTLVRDSWRKLLKTKLRPKTKRRLELNFKTKSWSKREGRDACKGESV